MYLRVGGKVKEVGIENCGGLVSLKFIIGILILATQFDLISKNNVHFHFSHKKTHSYLIYLLGLLYHYMLKI